VTLGLKSLSFKGIGRQLGGWAGDLMEYRLEKGSDMIGVA
jgi:hypothetical protein